MTRQETRLSKCHIIRKCNREDMFFDGINRMKRIVNWNMNIYLNNWTICCTLVCFIGGCRFHYGWYDMILVKIWFCFIHHYAIFSWNSEASASELLENCFIVTSIRRWVSTECTFWYFHPIVELWHFPFLSLL